MEAVESGPSRKAVGTDTAEFNVIAGTHIPRQLDVAGHGGCGLQEGVDEAWGQVENVYQRRADLIPNLVATVKGAADFEQLHEKYGFDYSYSIAQVNAYVAARVLIEGLEREGGGPDKRQISLLDPGRKGSRDS